MGGSNKPFLFIFTSVLLQLQRIPTEAFPTNNINIISTDQTLQTNTEIIDDSVQSKYLPRKCTAGTIYNISDPKDLFKHEEDLMCIFDVALPPNKVIEGPLYGDVLHIGNSHIFNSLTKKIWTGKFIEKVICNGTEKYLGWNKIVGQPHFAFVSRIGKIGDLLNLDPFERADDKHTLFIDYTKDLSKECPDFYEMVQKNKETLVIQKPGWNKHFFPLNPIVDVIRFVGRQSDGGGIYLGKMFGKDAFSTEEAYEVLAWFLVVNYDQGVLPEFKAGDALPPLEKDFYYKLAGIGSLAAAINPIDNILREPIHATKAVVKEFFKSTRGFTNFFIDLCFGSSGDSKRLAKIFEETRPQFNSTIKDATDLDSHPNKSHFLLSDAADHSHFNEL